MKFDICVFFKKICQENSSFIKYDKNNNYFTWWPIYVYGDLTEFFLDWEMF